MNFNPLQKIGAPISEHDMKIVAQRLERKGQGTISYRRVNSKLYLYQSYNLDLLANVFRKITFRSSQQHSCKWGQKPFKSRKKRRQTKRIDRETEAGEAKVHPNGGNPTHGPCRASGITASLFLGQ